MPQISFGRMVGYYTRDFRSSNVEAATDYLTLLCLNGDLPEKAGKAQVSLCHEALRELVLETREFAKLLGDIRSNGQRVPGAVEKRIRLIRLAHEDDDFLNTLTLHAAALADENGRATDAVLLYHLAGEYDKVISIVNRALSEAICVDVGDEPLKLQPLKAVSQIASGAPNNNNIIITTTSLSLTAVDDPAELARKMVGMYNQNALYYSKIRPANRDACGVLMRMSDARQKVEAGAWAEALDIISTLGILPLGAHGQMAVIRAAAQSFNNQQLLSPLPVSQPFDNLNGGNGGGNGSRRRAGLGAGAGDGHGGGGGGGDQHRRYYTAYVSRTVGHLLTWTIMCCMHQRQLLRASVFGGMGSSRQQVADELAVQAKDLMVFAGLIRYHLPPRVFETLARAGAEIDSW
jgi:nuclear pore complex protein Nup93